MQRSGVSLNLSIWVCASMVTIFPFLCRALITCMLYRFLIHLYEQTVAEPI